MSKKIYKLTKRPSSTENWTKLQTIITLLGAGLGTILFTLIGYFIWSVVIKSYCSTITNLSHPLIICALVGNGVCLIINAILNRRLNRGNRARIIIKFVISAILVFVVASLSPIAIYALALMFGSWFKEEIDLTYFWVPYAIAAASYLLSGGVFALVSIKDKKPSDKKLTCCVTIIPSALTIAGVGLFLWQLFTAKSLIANNSITQVLLFCATLISILATALVGLFCIKVKKHPALAALSVIADVICYSSLIIGAVSLVYGLIIILFVVAILSAKPFAAEIVKKSFEYPLSINGVPCRKTKFGDLEDIDGHKYKHLYDNVYDRIS